MLPTKKRYIQLLARRFWGVLFAFVITLAVVVQLCREAFPLLNEYRFHISGLLSEKLGLQVQIGEVQAVWSGLRPKIQLFDVTLSAEDGSTSLSVANANVELSLIDSLAEWRLVWRRVEFDSVQVALAKSDAGRWSIRGMPPRRVSSAPKAPNSHFSIDDPLDVFLIARYVHLQDVKVNAYFPTGHQTEFGVTQLTLENDKDFHRIQANAGFDGEDQNLTLIVEGYGDPRVPAEFDSSGYLSVYHFPLERVLAALPGNLWQAKEGEWREGHQLDGALWYQGNSSKGIRVHGQLLSGGLPLNVPEYVLLPDSVAANISGGWQPKSGWDISLSDIAVRWPEFNAPVLDLRLTGAQAGTVEIDKLNIEPWQQVLVKMGLDKTRFGKTLVNLAPRGTLHDISAQLVDKADGSVRVKARLANGAIDAFLGVPKLENVNALVELTANGGTAYVKSDTGFTLGLPKIYEQPLRYDVAEGRINWHLDWKHHLAYLGTGLLTLKNEGEVGHGYLHLTLPFSRKYGEAKMTLSVGVEKTDLANYRKYVPTTVPTHLYQWLQSSIGNGQISDVKFLYHGSLDGNAEVSPSVQLIGHVSGGDLAFDDHWPRLTDVSGRLQLDNSNLDVTIESASLLNNRVSEANITLVGGSHSGEPQALEITGVVNSNAAAAMKLLQNSPVRAAIGSTFDSWIFGGNVSAEIELLVPLTADSTGMRQLVSVNFKDADVDMSDIDLQVHNVEGRLKYDSEEGLLSDGLYGSIWGKPVQATIASPAVGTSSEGDRLRDTEIRFSGVADVADVRAWTKRPELAFLTGGAVAKGKLVIPASGTKDYSVAISLTSQLQGVTLALPEPLAKKAQFKKDFALELKIFDTYQTQDYRYDDFVKLHLILGDKSRETAQVALGGVEVGMQPGYFDVVGNIASYDLLEWDLVRERYFDYVAQGAAAQGESESEGFPIRLNLDIGECTIGSVGIDDVKVKGYGTEEKWEFTFSSEIVAGNAVLYSDDRPVIMDLDYLHLEEETPAVDADAPESHSNEERVTAIASAAEGGESGAGSAANQADSFLADIDIGGILPTDFSVGEFTYGKKQFGRWQFKVRPVEDGIALRNLQGKIRGIDVGIDSSGAEFVWLQKSGVNSSFFTGNLHATGGASVLEAWEFEKILDSKSTSVFAEVNWPGAPDQVALETIKGRVLVNMKNGNFIRDAQTGENPLLRLIALLNFDTIARRLRLDFSDLAKEGFAFDKVNADFEFSSGKIYLHNPVIVESSSSKMQLAGIVDVVNEEIDAQLVVTLPVAGDLTVAAALIAGLPAAVGLYIVSKVFHKQVDKVSSINYQITGAWDDPKIKFKKIFDNSAARKKAEEVKTINSEEKQRTAPANENLPETAPSAVPSSEPSAPRKAAIDNDTRSPDVAPQAESDPSNSESTGE